MGIMVDGPNGGVSGKFGSVVGYKRYGKWVVRGLSKAPKKKRKPSAKQKTCRDRFATVQHFLKMITSFVRITYRLEGIKNQMSAHNVAKSNILRNALNSEGQIMYEKVEISHGSLPGIVDEVVRHDDDGIHIHWTDNSRIGNASSKDQLLFLVYDVENDDAQPCLSAARRDVGYQQLILDKHYTAGRNYHLWVSFISDDRMTIATSTYLGMINT
ncbi:DUF6266 family protein [Pedobacter frigidisoli]|uniref:DUF6266 family protein n=1 Tax=Pedobacter frigidisoli TaxID=2530455 RepID=UPI00292FF757|nr:DUF6266 family protein [Pedobacter frigidisoli]